MTILFKARGDQLPTVIFHGDHVYEFVKAEPNLFEFETDDQEVVKFLVDMGFTIKEPCVVEQEEVVEDHVGPLEIAAIPEPIPPPPLKAPPPKKAAKAKAK
jgi:hypothetical protein